MSNYFQLVATLHKVDELRYTPAGVPVLEVVLQHESWQQENGVECKVCFQLPAKIVGPLAKMWQQGLGQVVQVSGFIAQRSQKTVKPILRIQNIEIYKG